MARTAAPAVPGTPPTTGADESLAQDALQAGALAAAATSEAGEAKDANALLHATVAQQSSEIASLKAMVAALGRNQAAQVAPEKVELPDLAAVMKQKPDVPVLTKQGWYVPPKLPNAAMER